MIMNMSQFCIETSRAVAFAIKEMLFAPLNKFLKSALIRMTTAIINLSQNFSIIDYIIIPFTTFVYSILIIACNYVTYIM